MRLSIWRGLNQMGQKNVPSAERKILIRSFQLSVLLFQKEVVHPVQQEHVHIVDIPEWLVVYFMAINVR